MNQTEKSIDLIWDGNVVTYERADSYRLKHWLALPFAVGIVVSGFFGVIKVKACGPRLLLLAIYACGGFATLFCVLSLG